MILKQPPGCPAAVSQAQGTPAPPSLRDKYSNPSHMRYAVPTCYSHRPLQPLASHNPATGPHCPLPQPSYWTPPPPPSNQNWTPLPPPSTQYWTPPSTQYRHPHPLLQGTGPPAQVCPSGQTLHYQVMAGRDGV